MRTQFSAGSVGSDVMRVYRYLRTSKGKEPPLPGIRFAATGLHTDMGLLTVSPLSSLPELMLLKPDARCLVCLCVSVCVVDNRR